MLVVLGNFADETGISYPSQKTLASITAQSERAVRDHLHQLELAGLIERRNRYRGDGTRTSDKFQLAGGFGPSADRPQSGDKSRPQGTSLEPAADSAGGGADYRQISPRLPADSSATTGNGCRGSVSDPSDEPKRSSGHPQNRNRKRPETERERRFYLNHEDRPLSQAEAKRGLESVRDFINRGGKPHEQNGR